MTNVIWLKGGACSGNTMSFLNAEQPSVIELVTDFGLHMLYHPSIGMEIGEQVNEVLEDALSGRVHLDIFVFEGTVIQGSNGTGNMNIFAGRPMQEWVRDMAGIADYVVAIGDCAAWGGIIAVPPNPTESTGVQYHKAERGGFLGKDFISRGGLPVINIPGCPAHPDWMT
ncbi:MAG: hypothetical protein KDD15_03085 [Lewinella sp.]|nr:hypothetical protein [Lewinella sp.]